MKFEIRYGLEGGFGGCGDWETIEVKDKDDAEAWARDYAIEVYSSYGGMHGLFNDEDALEDDPTLTEEALNELFWEDVENWIVYEVREV